MDGSELARCRQELGLTQIELAAELGVPQATISRWENRKHAIEHGAMLALALQAIAWRPIMTEFHVLGVKARVLLKGEQDAS